MFVFNVHSVFNLGRKCTWTASGCPNCFKGNKRMGKAPKRMVRYRYCSDDCQHTRHDITNVLQCCAMHIGQHGECESFEEPL